MPARTLQTLQPPRDATADGVTIHAQSSQVMVLNSDATDLNHGGSNAFDPWAIDNGTGTNHANVLVLNTQNWSYLDLHTAYTYATASAPTISQFPVVQVFGFFPITKGANYQRDDDLYNLSDVDAAFPQLAELNSNSKPGIWLPLVKPGYTAGSPSLTLSGPIEYLAHGTSELMAITEPKFVWLGGAQRAMVLVGTAMATSGGTLAAASILGRLSV